MKKLTSKGLGMRFAAGLRRQCALAFFVMTPFFITSPAKADFRVCNGTPNLVGVSIGYRTKNGWTTEGWFHIKATSCRVLIKEALQSRFYYLYAEDAESGNRWQGPITMCVAGKAFKITGVTDCVSKGYFKAGFQEYDTGARANWMVQLNDDSATSTENKETGAPQQ